MELTSSISVMQGGGMVGIQLSHSRRCAAVQMQTVTNVY